MKGEKVDLNSIKASVTEEMKNVGKRAEKFGKEAATAVSEKSERHGKRCKEFFQKEAAVVSVM